MKHFTFNFLSKKSLLLVALIGSSLTASADEWGVIYSNSMSAETADGVTLTDPIYTSGDEWSIAANGASIELGKTGAENFGPCLTNVIKDSYIAVKYEIKEEGTYKFSFVHKVKEGTYGANAKLVYATEPGEWYDAYQVMTPAPVLEDDATGEVVNSTEIELTPGVYYFAYMLGSTFGSSKDLHVADFSLSQYGGSVTPETKYTFSYKVEGNNAQVSVTDAEGNEIPNNSELSKYDQYNIAVTPENNDVVTITVNGMAQDTWQENGVYKMTSYIVDNTEVVINITTGIKNVTNIKSYYNRNEQTVYNVDGCDIQIYSLTGNLVASTRNSKTLEVSYLPEGIYIAKAGKTTFKFRK